MKIKYFSHNLLFCLSVCLSVCLSLSSKCVCMYVCMYVCSNSIAVTCLVDTKVTIQYTYIHTYIFRVSTKEIDRFKNPFKKNFYKILALGILYFVQKNLKFIIKAFHSSRLVSCRGAFCAFKQCHLRTHFGKSLLTKQSIYDEYKKIETWYLGKSKCPEKPLVSKI